jgi:phosphoribosylformylglycinamidine cyclo-ligase
VSAARSPSTGLTYRDTGVDIDVKTRLLDDVASAITATHTADVAAGVGAFAGALRLPATAGIIAATTDGVGTKTLLARRLHRDEVIGADIVAHCANDLVAQGARPVAFLDYIAMGRLEPPVVATLIRAMARACTDVGAVLLGGETAEMPDVYLDGAYDVVGTMIGTTPSEGLITGAGIAPGHRLIGLASTGPHTNGYSLIRRVTDALPLDVLRQHDAELGATPADALLAPHRCYAPATLSLLSSVRVRGIAHITGGGLVDNLTRILPDDCQARIDSSWPRPPVFGWLQRLGRIPDADMLATFNLGIGMVVVVSPRDIDVALEHFAASNIPACDIGAIVEGPKGVIVR